MWKGPAVIADVIDSVSLSLFVLSDFHIYRNIDVVKLLQENFGFDLPSVLWAKRASRFEGVYNSLSVFRL